MIMVKIMFGSHSFGILCHKFWKYITENQEVCFQFSRKLNHFCKKLIKFCIIASTLHNYLIKAMTKYVYNFHKNKSFVITHKTANIFFLTVA